MPNLTEGRLVFEFPENMYVKKYDETNMYRENINSICGGNKGVDFIAIDEHSVWFIEVKDFRLGDRKDTGAPLSQEIEQKFRDSVFGLIAMRAGIKTKEDEVKFAADAIARNIKIIFHMEEGRKKGVPRGSLSLSIQNKLCQNLRPFGSVIRVCDMRNTAHLPWRVTEN